MRRCRLKRVRIDFSSTRFRIAAGGSTPTLQARSLDSPKRTKYLGTFGITYSEMRYVFPGRRGHFRGQKAARSRRQIGSNGLDFGLLWLLVDVKGRKFGSELISERRSYLGVVLADKLLRQWQTGNASVWVAGLTSDAGNKT